ncbi:MAG: hypothetical protein PHX36_10785, partial [Mesotoga sp.]|uniref:hypothetical protein n=1 Tax=Mesotoga sp. TaxID=2053577 RepID=UPI002623A61A
GDPYSAFARIAAMTAIVSSVLAMAGIAFGGSGAGSAATTSTLPKSTVLGAAAGTGSESLYNSYELLEDTYDMQYSELSKLNKSMRDLNNNISGLVANILQYGIGGASSWNVAEGKVYGSSYKYGKQFDDIAGYALAGATLGPVGLIINYVMEKLTGNFVGELVGKLFNYVFGGKVTTAIEETGLAMQPGSVSSVMAGLGIDAQTYALIKAVKDGGLFSSDKTSYKTQYDELATSTKDLIGSIYEDISTTLVFLTDEFGTDMSKTLGYAFESIKLNLKDMDAEEINETLQNYFSGIGDTAVEALFGTLLRGYQEVGEGLMETAVRLVRDKAVISDILEKTNQEFIGSIKNIIAFSEELIKLAGGLDVLQDSFETYYKSFIPESERMANTYKDISSVLGDLNMALPETRDGYKELVESLDLSFKEVTSVVSSSSGTASAVNNTASQLKSLGMVLTAAIAAGDVAKIQQYQAAMNVLMNNMNNAANQTATTIGTTTTVITKGQQEQYAALLLYAEYADAYYSYIEEIEAKRASMQIELLEAQGKSEEALALQRQMELDAMDESLRALQEEIWATEELSKAMEEVANRSETVSDWLNSLITSSVIPVTSAEAYQEQYDKLYAESGTAEGLSDFLNYATQYLNFMKSYSGDYLDIYNKVIRDVSVLDPEYVSPQQAFVNDFLANPANYGGVDRENILGSYASGTDYVPKTGPYILHEGEKVIRSSDNSSADNKKIIQILSSLVSSAQPIVIPLDGKVIAKTVGKYIPITPELTDAIRRVQ